MLRLFDDAGNELAINNNVGPGGGDDNLSRIDFQFDTDGTYFIGVSGNLNSVYNPQNANGTADGETGDYNLLIDLDDLEFEDESRETPFPDIDLFQLEAEAGDTLFARTESQVGSDDNVNTFLCLFDSDGKQITFDDNSGPSLYSEFEFTFDTEGIDYVGVTAFPVLFYDPTVSDGTGLIDYGTDPLVEEEGDYRLTLSLDSGDTQATARDTEIGPAGGTFNFEATLGDGPLGNGDFDLYRFEATAGQFLTAETSIPSRSAGGVDTVLRVFDDNGNQLAFNNDVAPLAGDLSSRIVFEILTSGIYFVGVSGNPNTVYDPQTADGTVAGDTGDYVLRLDAANVSPTGEIQGTRFNDQNANGVQDPGEDGIAGQTMFLDLNGNGVFDPSGTPLPTTFNAPNLPGPIQDADTTSFQLSVSGFSSAITDVNLTLDISHTFDSDLVVTLIAPSGTRVRLFSDIGGSADNFTNTTLDDQAAQSINNGSAPFTGTFRPEGLLAVLNGESPNGFWQLEIEDTASLDTGTLNSWSLEILTDLIGPNELATLPEPFTVTDAEGNYAFTELAPGTFRVGEVLPTGTLQTLPEAGRLLITELDLGAPDLFEFQNVIQATIDTTGWQVLVGDVDSNINFVDSGRFNLPTSLAPGQVVTATESAEFTGSIGWFPGRSGWFPGRSGWAMIVDDVGEIVDWVGWGWTAAEIDSFSVDTGGFQNVTLDEYWNGPGAVDNGVGTLQRSENVDSDDASDFAFAGQSRGTQNVNLTFPFVALQTVIVPAGQIVSGVDFGNFTPPTEIRGTKFDDLNGNGFRDAGEPGVEGITIFLDENGNGILDSQSDTFTSPNVPIDILDLTTVLSSLDVNGLNGAITDVNLTLDITHTFAADLDVFLISPTGTRVELFVGVGGGADNFTNTTFDDQAAQSIFDGNAPFTGSFRPAGILATLDGEDPNGIWQLEITDVFFADQGTLNSWSLTILTDQPSPGEPFTVTDANGDYTFTNVVPGIRTVQEVLPSRFVQTFPRFRPALELFRADFGSNGQQFDSFDVPLPIQDFVPNVSQINVNGLNPATINDVNLTLDITHPFDGDLDVFLISPVGTRVELFTGVGGPGDNFTNTTFDDDAAQSITNVSVHLRGSFSQKEVWPL